MVLFCVIVLWMNWVLVVFLWFLSSVFGLMVLIMVVVVGSVLCRFSVMWCGFSSSMVLDGSVVRVVGVCVYFVMLMLFVVRCVCILVGSLLVVMNSVVC